MKIHWVWRVENKIKTRSTLQFFTINGQASRYVTSSVSSDSSSCLLIWWLQPESKSLRIRLGDESDCSRSASHEPQSTCPYANVPHLFCACVLFSWQACNRLTNWTCCQHVITWPGLPPRGNLALQYFPFPGCSGWAPIILGTRKSPISSTTSPPSWSKSGNWKCRKR